MKISILALGRQKGGPEAALVSDYLKRFDAAGRGLGLGPAKLLEFEDRKRVGESRLLLDAAPEGAYVFALDERGETSASRAFARRLGALRDEQGRDEEALALYRESLRHGLSEDVERTEQRVRELGTRFVDARSEATEVAR